MDNDRDKSDEKDVIIIKLKNENLSLKNELTEKNKALNKYIEKDYTTNDLKDTLRNDIISLEVKINEYENNLKKKDIEIVGFKNNIATYINEITKLKLELANKYFNLGDPNRLLSYLSRQVQKGENKELESLIKEKKELQSQNEELLLTYAEQQKQSTESDKNYEKLLVEQRKEVNILKSKLTKIKIENQNLKLLNPNNKKTEKITTEDYTALTYKYNEATDEIKRIKDKITNYESTIEQLNKE